MTRTHFADPTGLSPDNVSTANDLAKLVRAAAEYPLIREFSTTPRHFVEVQPTGRMLGFNNSNGLVQATAGRSSCRRPATSARPGAAS